MDEVGRPLTIGALAKATGCQVETIRFYEHAGLLPAPHRSPGGYRLYGGGHVTRLTFVRRARELGFSLAEVRTMLRLADERARPCADVRVVATAHLRDVRARIADLQAMERVLRTTVRSLRARRRVRLPAPRRAVAGARLRALASTFFSPAFALSDAGALRP